MKYLEIINEGRDAPLYHGCSFFAATSIIQHDEIWAGTQHSSDKLYMDGEDEEIFGVSLSRSKSLSANFGPVVFEIDQRRLAQTRKIVPLDYWSASNPRKPSLRGHNPHPGGDRYEFEEFCLGHIQPLSRYLLAIHMTPSGVKQAERHYAGKMELIEPILQHPLLKIDNRFVNSSVKPVTA